MRRLEAARSRPHEGRKQATGGQIVTIHDVVGVSGDEELVAAQGEANGPVERGERAEERPGRAVVPEHRPVPVAGDVQRAVGGDDDVLGMPQSATAGRDELIDEGAGGRVETTDVVRSEAAHQQRRPSAADEAVTPAPPDRIGAGARHARPIHVVAVDDADRIAFQPHIGDHGPTAVDRAEARDERARIVESATDRHERLGEIDELGTRERESAAGIGDDPPVPDHRAGAAEPDVGAARNPPLVADAAIADHTGVPGARQQIHHARRRIEQRSAAQIQACPPIVVAVE